MKRIVFLLIVLIVFTLQSFSQTISPSTIKLSRKDRKNSALFQSLKGTERLSVFSQLQSLIRVKDASNTANTSSANMGAKTTKVEEIIALLGQPDFSSHKTFLRYNLNATATERLIIGIDKSGEVEYCTIKK